MSSHSSNNAGLAAKELQIHRSIGGSGAADDSQKKDMKVYGGDNIKFCVLLHAERNSSANRHNTATHRGECMDY